MRLRRQWWAALDHDFTPDGVCDDETYGRLPALAGEVFTGDFGWLVAEAAGADAYYMEPRPVPKRALGPGLPESFRTFMSDGRLQGRVPSSTGNGWEISPLTPSPVEEHGFLLRFMHGQQGTWFYYLYLAEDGSCPVLGSAELLTPEGDDEPDDVLTRAEFMERVTWAAPDFEQFVYRYWVENVIWHHVVHRQRPAADLPAGAQRYLTLLRTPHRPPLDDRPAPLRWRSDSPDQLRLW